MGRIKYVIRPRTIREGRYGSGCVRPPPGSGHAYQRPYQAGALYSASTSEGGGTIKPTLSSARRGKILWGRAKSSSRDSGAKRGRGYSFTQTRRGDSYSKTGDSYLFHR